MDKARSPAGSPERRIALASSDGHFINMHFGKATSFYVLTVAPEGEVSGIERREAQPFCGTEDGSAGMIGTVADCDVVVVAQIGHAAREACFEVGIQAHAWPGPVEAVLQDLGVSLPGTGKIGV